MLFLNSLLLDFTHHYGWSCTQPQSAASTASIIIKPMEKAVAATPETLLLAHVLSTFNKLLLLF
ncbi:MAG: hypothetical protein QXF09_04205 [Nitrososphaerota archaeon]